VNATALKKLCLSFNGAEETYPFGPETAVFKVEGKMFALSQLGAEDLRVSLKCEPALAEQLRAAHPEVIPGYHLNKRHWNTVMLGGGLDDGMVRDLVEDSYDLVVSKLPKSKRLRLGWEPEGLAAN
jgi:predicted DNA-binding protein (MmcQ/YjbR family)